MAEKRPIPPETPAVPAEPLRILRFPIRPAKGPYREGCSPRVFLAHKVLCTNNFLLIFMPFVTVHLFLTAAIGLLGAVAAWADGQIDTLAPCAAVWAAAQAVFIRARIGNEGRKAPHQ
jgi:hypothetical protein